MTSPQNHWLHLSALLPVIAGLMISTRTFSQEPTPFGQADTEYNATASQETAVASPVSNDMRPNIIFILLDDAGYDDFGGRDLIRPNIDRLASESLRVESFYTAPMCSPTRTSLLTAHYPARYGLQWVYGRKTIRGIEQSDHTLIDAFNEAGYITAHFGKWHAGQGEGYGMFDVGYDYAMNPGGVVQNGYHNPVVEYPDGSTRRFPGDHTTDVITDHVLEFLKGRDSSTEPFLLNVWYHAPHAPHQPSERWLKRYPHSDKYRRYEALFSQADENIGRILDYLDSEAALRANTIVFLASDNGGTQGARANNGGLRGYKADVFEGGIKSPLFIRWPNTIRPGSSDKIITAMDIPPTLLEFAAVNDLLDRDGLSFAGHIKDSTTDRGWNRIEPIFWMHKLKGDLKNPRKFRPEFAQLSWAVREENWKLVFEPLDSADFMLFDLSADPGEQVDQAASNQEAVRTLYYKYLDWKQTASRLPMTVARLEGAVIQNNTQFTFPVAQSGEFSRVVFDAKPIQNIYDQDFTFLASIEPDRGDGSSRIVAAKPGAWAFRINMDNKLELELHGAKVRKQLIAHDVGIVSGRRYDVAFSVVGMKKLPNYGRIFVREEGAPAYRLAAEGIGVRAVNGTGDPIVLGNGVDGGEPLSGLITDPRFFLAPFSIDELNSL